MACESGASTEDGLSQRIFFVDDWLLLGDKERLLIDRTTTGKRFADI